MAQCHSLERVYCSVSTAITLDDIVYVMNVMMVVIKFHCDGYDHDAVMTMTTD